MPDSPTPDSPAPRTPRRSGEVLLRVAVGLFAVGMLAIVAIFLTPLVTDGDPPLWLYLVAMAATPLGLLLAIFFALWSGRQAR
ncbi:putative membrane protein [Nocardia nova SH22a]|uniref:Putative membrane protein n=1 Tax=Nocardia nova SH22a TaxID=1415166 RepID=W5T953_9NOCA|nr:hypothetical protein [Nocardia nova]AHH15508.1 putative membrane protein [Nocardia nova SH22a]